MTWIKYKKDSCPEKPGQYFVIKYHEGTKEMAFFKPIPPKKTIELMEYRLNLQLEQEMADRCIYIKYNAFFDKHGIEQKREEILYWYRLDEMPEED
jgi:hypothetical protein